MDSMFKLGMVTERETTKLEWQDLFADMGIGTGWFQYTRGLTMLQNTGLDCEQARKELAHWCGV